MSQERAKTKNCSADKARDKKIHNIYQICVYVYASQGPCCRRRGAITRIVEDHHADALSSINVLDQTCSLNIPEATKKRDQVPLRVVEGDAIDEQRSLQEGEIVSESWVARQEHLNEMVGG